MVDVNTFKTYISHDQLLFEEQTLDRLSKIRVSPLKAIQNIRELKGKFEITNTKHVVSVNEEEPQRVNGINISNQIIQPQMPFMLNSLHAGAARRQPIGMMIPQENRPRTTPPPPQQAAAMNRVYQNQKQNSDISMSLHKRPINGNGIQNHKQFGMKGLFM
jgi:hypothetical protein